MAESQAGGAAVPTKEELRALCQQYQQADEVPWRVVARACEACRDSTAPTDQAASAQEGLQGVCSGSSIKFCSPPPRQRSAALQKRLSELQAELDNKQYAAMVEDITSKERASKEQQQDNFFPTTKLQLSFGLHVLVTMGTFFALAYYAARMASASQTLATAAGAVGMSLGMLLETSLFIVRMNMPPSLDVQYAHLMDKKYDSKQPQQQKQQQQQKQAATGAGGKAGTKAAAAGGGRDKRRIKQGLGVVGEGGGALGGTRKKDQ